jgi:superfamily II DNA helicase RecQ
VRLGNGVVLAVPTGAGKTLPMITASLETGKLGVIILPLISIEQQMERELTRLNIPFLNLTSTGDLERALRDTKPQILITNVEALANKQKREILRKSRLEVGHFGWDEAMVSYKSPSLTQSPYR